MKIIKSHWKFIIFVLICAVIGGIFTGIYTINSYDEAIVNELLKQIKSKELFVLITTIQVILYAIFSLIFGLILSEKIKLWKQFEFKRVAIITVLIIIIVGGLLLSFGDYYIFGALNEKIKESYNLKPTIEYIISSFTYGGVIEEIVLRLFFMSLISLILYKIFYRKKEEIPTHIHIISNIISALAFAILHIPATIQMFGGLTFLLFARCLIMNGIFGISFGFLYRKYGIGYAILGHFGCHLISKIIWILFI